MKSKITIIMMAGSNERWLKFRDPSMPKVKQFVEVAGKRLIDYTTEYHDKRGIDYWIAVRSDSIAKELSAPQMAVVGNTSTLMESILRVEPLWKETTTFLLGDVAYSEMFLDHVYQRDGDFLFFGRPWETYAIKVKNPTPEIFMKASRINEGKLRDLRYYLRFKGLPPKNLDEKADRIADPNYLLWCDWTRDIDHKLNLAGLLKSEAAMEELERR